jgi:hypothetical protein
LFPDGCLRKTARRVSHSISLHHPVTCQLTRAPYSRMLIEVLSRENGIFLHLPSGSGENILVRLMARSLFVFPCQDPVVIMMNLDRYIFSALVQPSSTSSPGRSLTVMIRMRISSRGSGRHGASIESSTMHRLPAYRRPTAAFNESLHWP